MKIYESKLAQLPGHILWTFCLYAIIGVIVAGLFFLFAQETDSTNLTTFVIIGVLWLGQSWRFRKMCYKINEDVLVQYDFQSRTILIEQIVSVKVLDKIKWVSCHTPYNMVIETMDKNKYFIAPEEALLLAATLKKENPNIQVIR